MTSNYLTDTSLDVGNILFSPTSTAALTSLARKKGAKRLLDTIESAGGEGKSAAPTGRPTLPKSEPQIPADEMMQIVAAFCQAYGSISNGIQTQTGDYGNLMQLDQTQTQAVLQSTTDAINKQQAAEKEAEQIQSYESHMSEVEKIFGWTMAGLGALLMIATVASAFFDAGASLAALPEEAGLEMTVIGAAEGTADAAGDAAADGAADAAADGAADGAADAGADGAGSSLQGTAGDSSSVTNTTGDVGQTDDDLDSDGANNEKSDSTLKRTLGKIGLRLGVAAVTGSPMLLQGVTSIQVSDRLANLAANQKIVGQALDVVSRNNMYFQFLQQLLQREGGVLTEETNDASEVVDTFSSITSALRGISYGLASAA